MVIFHSYVSLPEGTVCELESDYLQLIYPLKMVIFHSFLYVYQAG